MNIFKNPELENQFKKKGYLHLKRNKSLKIQEIIDFYKEIFTEKKEGFYTTQCFTNTILKDRSSDFLKESFKPIIDDLCIDYKALVGNYAIKSTGKSSELVTHQDWSIVDEQKHTYINIWCSLQKIYKKDGALKVVPYSHLFPRFKRSIGINSPFDSFLKEIEEFAITIETEPGDIVIWEGSLFHSSLPNMGDQERIASLVIAIPKNADSFFHQKKDNYICSYLIKDDFFKNYNLGQEKIENAFLIQKEKINDKKQSELKELKTKCINYLNRNLGDL